MSSAIKHQLAVAGPRLPADKVEAVREALATDTWGLWCILYVDASNAGHGTAKAWGWGARARVDDSVASILEAPHGLTRGGLSPEAGSGDSGIGELWGIVHAVRACIDVWPWLAGIGVRCDNAEAVRAVACPRDRYDGRRVLVPALRALRDIVDPARVQIRAKHVRGHNRAELDRQKSFNSQADKLARQAAARVNRGSA